MLLVESLDKLFIVGFHIFAHHFDCGFFIATNNRDRFRIASEVTNDGVGFLLSDLRVVTTLTKMNGILRSVTLRICFRPNSCACAVTGALIRPAAALPDFNAVKSAGELPA